LLLQLADNTLGKIAFLLKAARSSCAEPAGGAQAPGQPRRQLTNRAATESNLWFAESSARAKSIVKENTIDPLARLFYLLTTIGDGLWQRTTQSCSDGPGSHHWESAWKNWCTGSPDSQVFGRSTDS
jgi:hypothetical protein